MMFMSLKEIRTLGSILVLSGAALMAAPASSFAYQGTAPAYRSASQHLMMEGQAAMEAADYKTALTKFETALVADPNNLAALVAIGRAHEALGDRSAGIAYYRRVLTIEPDNRAALAAESLAYLADFGLVKARQNLDLLKRLCGTEGCEEVDEVRAAIAAFEAESPEDSPADQGKS
ncbi:hypothetical protein GCM10007972_18990 [Iodidimonas muriae]|uniref:Tetratricopeptide repeat protein n=1 Tax=Iodidimonas muriae TaxID=261467 RepID=A0ABQ2LEP2_9PROT|nr:tetratricopeptide repeat protein [Iodidimonas muriae]GGO13122.1 hypothetical protein GCM10007972_18990 [Iodidimonas muriae]